MNEELINKIREVLGYSDEGLDLFNAANSKQLSQEEQDRYIEGLEIVRSLQINNTLLDVIIRSNGDLNILSEELEKVFDELDARIDEATDPILKTSLEL